MMIGLVFKLLANKNIALCRRLSGPHNDIIDHEQSTTLFEHAHIPGRSSSNNGTIRQAVTLPSPRIPSSSCRFSRLQLIGNSIWSSLLAFKIILWKNETILTFSWANRFSFPNFQRPFFSRPFFFKTPWDLFFQDLFFQDLFSRQLFQRNYFCSIRY